MRKMEGQYGKLLLDVNCEEGYTQKKWLLEECLTSFLGSVQSFINSHFESILCAYTALCTLCKAGFIRRIIVASNKIVERKNDKV